MEEEIIKLIKEHKTHLLFELKKTNEYVDYNTLFLNIYLDKSFIELGLSGVLCISNINFGVSSNVLKVNVEKYNIRDIIRLFDIKISDIVNLDILSKNLELKRVKKIYDSLNLEFL